MNDKSTRSLQRARGCGANENHRRVAIPMLERLRENTRLVRNAELRLMNQRSFIERLEAADRDRTSAEEALEVMRNLLGDLYQERTVLRRHLVNESKASGTTGKSGGAADAKRKQKSLSNPARRY